MRRRNVRSAVDPRTNTTFIGCLSVISKKSIKKINDKIREWTSRRLTFGRTIYCVKGVMADTDNQIIGATINSHWCNFKVEFIKYCGVYSTLIPVSFNPSCHRYREMANHKDELVESFFKSN